MSTEELIENVRKHSILYDLSHSEYKNIKKKDKIWDEIPLVMGQGTTGDELKKKWKNLRDSYSKYLRSEKTKTGQETKLLDRYKTWPWAKQMEFLRNSLKFVTTGSNVCSQTTEQATDQTKPAVIEEEPREEHAESDSLELGKNHIVVNQPKTKKAKRGNETISTPSSSASSVQQVISYLDKRASTCDEIDDLFRAYAKTVKKCTPRRQAMVKFKFSQILMEEELAQLEEEEQHSKYRTNLSTPIRLNSRASSSFVPSQHNSNSSTQFQRTMENQCVQEINFHSSLRPTESMLSVTSPPHENPNTSYQSSFTSPSHENAHTSYHVSQPSSPATWYEDFGKTVNNIK